MSARRDFLAFTAGAVVARTIVTIAARAEPSPRQSLEEMALTCPATRRMLDWWDIADNHQRKCFLQACQRIVADEPFAEVIALFRVERAESRV